MTVTVELTRDGDRLEIICDGLRPREVRLSPPPPGASPVVQVDGGRAQVDVDPSVPRYVATLTLDGGYRRVPERHVNLSGAANFRDLGGYGLPAGRTVRWGILFRSDHLDHTTGSDRTALAALGIREVVDLRKPGERPPPGTAHPLGNVVVHHVPIGGLVAHLNVMTERMLSGEIRDFSAADMRQVYIDLLDGHPAYFAQAVRHVAGATGPAVVNCTAGKDRTGLVAALVLSSLGAGREDVLRDYGLTQRYWSARKHAELRSRFTAPDSDFSQVQAFFDARPEALGGALDYLQTRHGGAWGYLCGAGRLPDTTLGLLRTRLTTATAVGANRGDRA